MFNLFKYIIIIIIVYYVLRFLRKIFQIIKGIDSRVKGQAKNSARINKYRNIEDADFEDIE
jgi:hypothetical protein